MHGIPPQSDTRPYVSGLHDDGFGVEIASSAPLWRPIDRDGTLLPAVHDGMNAAGQRLANFVFPYVKHGRACVAFGVDGTDNERVLARAHEALGRLDIALRQMRRSGR